MTTTEGDRVLDAPRRVVPAWPAPANVRAWVTTRDDGASRGAWGALDGGGGLNLGSGSGDDADAVCANRAALARFLPREPAWLRQVHGTTVVDAAAVSPIDAPEADASFTDRAGVVCVVLVADCLPVLFCDRAGTRVAAAHAGWRGLAAGVLERTLAAGGFEPAETVAWLGPAIGPARFEVGDDVRDTFRRAADAHTATAVTAAFVPRGAAFAGKWLADLPALARARLAALGVASITASGLCTASDAARFYSYRRDGITGRMAALVWLDG